MTVCQKEHGPVAAGRVLLVRPPVYAALGRVSWCVLWSFKRGVPYYGCERRAHTRNMYTHARPDAQAPHMNRVRNA